MLLGHIDVKERGEDLWIVYFHHWPVQAAKEGMDCLAYLVTEHLIVGGKDIICLERGMVHPLFQML